MKIYTIEDAILSLPRWKILKDFESKTKHKEYEFDLVIERYIILDEFDNECYIQIGKDPKSFKSNEYMQIKKIDLKNDKLQIKLSKNSLYYQFFCGLQEKFLHTVYNHYEPKNYHNKETRLYDQTIFGRKNPGSSYEILETQFSFQKIDSTLQETDYVHVVLFLKEFNVYLDHQSIIDEIEFKNELHSISYICGEQQSIS